MSRVGVTLWQTQPWHRHGSRKPFACMRGAGVVGGRHTSTQTKMLPLPSALRCGKPLSLPARRPLGFNSAKLSAFLRISFKHILSGCDLSTKPVRPSCELTSSVVFSLAMFCMGLTVHEEGCSFAAPFFPLSHHRGHVRSPAPVLPT